MDDWKRELVIDLVYKGLDAKLLDVVFGPSVIVDERERVEDEDLFVRNFEKSVGERFVERQISEAVICESVRNCAVEEDDLVWIKLVLLSDLHFENAALKFFLTAADRVCVLTVRPQRVDVMTSFFDRGLVAAFRQDIDRSGLARTRSAGDHIPVRFPSSRARLFLHL